MLLLLCCFVPVLYAQDWIEDTLKSRALLNAKFDEYLVNHGKSYKESDRSFRLRLFRNSLEEVVKCNEEQVYRCSLNQFVDLTLAEKHSLTGLQNITDNFRADEELTSLKARSIPVTHDWRDNNAVTPVKNQGLLSDCSSGFAYSAAAALEGAYSIATGTLPSFSGQELLDCTYHKVYSKYNSCSGGQVYDSFEFVRRSRHLSTDEEYPTRSKGYFGHCDKDSTKNALTDGYLQKYVSVDSAGGDDALVQALAINPVAVSMIFKGQAFYYASGIYDGLKDCSCEFDPTTHALTAVAYTATTFTLKNSFGASWGEAGYMTIARGVNTCRVSDFAYYPVVRKLGEPTNEPPTFVPTPDPECADEHIMCKSWASWGECVNNPGYMLSMCRLSCFECSCGDTNEKCPEWASWGECENNPNYMLGSCKLSCNVCDDTDPKPKPEPTDPPTPPPTNPPTKEPTDAPKPEPEDCVDKLDDCPARAANGDCHSASTWAEMEAIFYWCPNSCHQCSCGDNSEYCGVWADEGGCDFNPEWFKLHCKESCDMCEKTTPETCVDNDADCPTLAADDGCFRSTEYSQTEMKEKCPKSCHVCKCGDNSSGCPTYAEYGYCDSYSEFMHWHCADACGLC